MSSNVERKVAPPEFDANLSLADFVVGDSDDPLIPPLAFTQWHQAGAREVALYEPQMLASADPRTTINYEGRPHSVINLCSYNYLGLANRPEVIAASRDALSSLGDTPRVMAWKGRTRHDLRPSVQLTHVKARGGKCRRSDPKRCSCKHGVPSLIHLHMYIPRGSIVSAQTQPTVR